MGVPHPPRSPSSRASSPRCEGRHRPAAMAEDGEALEGMSSCSQERAEGMLGAAAGGDDDVGLLELLLAKREQRGMLIARHLDIYNFPTSPCLHIVDFVGNPSARTPPSAGTLSNLRLQITGR